MTSPKRADERYNSRHAKLYDDKLVFLLFMRGIHCARDAGSSLHSLAWYFLLLMFVMLDITGVGTLLHMDDN
jgi:hypothetical protein